MGHQGTASAFVQEVKPLSLPLSLSFSFLVLLTVSIALLPDKLTFVSVLFSLKNVYSSSFLQLLGMLLICFWEFTSFW